MEVTGRQKMKTLLLPPEEKILCLKSKLVNESIKQFISVVVE